MGTRKRLAVGLILTLGLLTPAAADDRKGRWWRGDVKDEYWNGPCEVKVESKRGEFKREIKCKDGAGATWRERGVREFRDGPCTVKVEAKKDEYKEEVKCDR
jgi:hypothetical protein